MTLPNEPDEIFEKPGDDLVQRGLTDLAQGVESVEALLVCIGAPRLRACGVMVSSVPAQPEFPEMRLYRRLHREDADTAHARYNALVRRLISYEQALESTFGGPRLR